MPGAILTLVFLVFILLTGVFHSLVWSFHVYRNHANGSTFHWSRPGKLLYLASSLVVLVLISLSLYIYTSAGPSDAWFILLCLIIRINSLNQVSPAIFLLLHEGTNSTRWFTLIAYFLVTSFLSVCLAWWLPRLGHKGLRTVTVGICTMLDQTTALFFATRFPQRLSIYLKWSIVQLTVTVFIFISLIVAFHEHEKHQDLIFTVNVFVLLASPGWAFISYCRNPSTTHNESERHDTNDAISEQHPTEGTAAAAIALHDMPPKKFPHTSTYSKALPSECETSPASIDYFGSSPKTHEKEEPQLESQDDDDHDTLIARIMKQSDPYPTFPDDASTNSVMSEIYDHEISHGRTYHALNKGKYLMPNDMDEIARMEMLDRAFNIVLQGDKYKAPVKGKDILDVGTGPGTWCVDVADDRPHSKVTGIDLSPIQPHYVPRNCQFEIADADDLWTYEKSRFDLIHTRCMYDYTLKSWSTFFRQAFDHLEPGGCLEMQEIGPRRSDDNIPSDSKFKLWEDTLQKAFNVIGLAGCCEPVKVMHQMQEAGFENVGCKTFKLPIGPWSVDKELMNAGIYCQIQLLDGLSGMSLKPFLDLLGYDRNSLEALLKECRKEIERTQVRAYLPLFVIIGQKPWACKGVMTEI